MTLPDDAGLPGTIGVVGGGRMGSGIAHAFLCCGSRVLIAEADPGAGERARKMVAAMLNASADRGKLAHPVEQLLAGLTIADSIAELADAGLVIEAVPEKVDLKVSVLGAVAATVAPDAVIASNTSSLSIGELSSAVPYPERFLGLHFFNPVPASKLVEVVTTAGTAADVVARAQGWVSALGKTAVTVTDSPGFASSRLGVLLGLEAIRMVEQQVADPADIDAAMTLGYGHPMGPLRLTDLVGLDVRLGIAEYLQTSLGDRFAPPELLRSKVSRGELGRKSGQGFYRWTD